MSDRADRKIRTGVVVSDARDKTVTVEIRESTRHSVYQKTVRSSKRLHAHDEANDARKGDTVRVMETRPLSKTKRWRVVEIVERAR
jgi:small subunit ribosomal protein S17